MGVGAEVVVVVVVMMEAGFMSRGAVLTARLTMRPGVLFLSSTDSTLEKNKKCSLSSTPSWHATGPVRFPFLKSRFHIASLDN